MALCSEFDAATPQQWRQVLERELKGKPYESLIRTLREGFAVSPDLWLTSAHNPEMPTSGSLRRGYYVEGPDWFNEVFVDCTDHDTAIKKMRWAKNAGADAFTLSEGVSERTIRAAMQFNPSLLNIEGLPPVLSYWDAPTRILYDPLAYHASRGIDMPTKGNYDYLIRYAGADGNCCQYCAEGAFFHNAGADAVTELALVIGSLHEMLNVLPALKKLELTNDDIGTYPSARMAAGGDFFVSVAKFRALYMLFARLHTLHDRPLTSERIMLFAQTSRIQQADRDIQTNLLRATTQALSAALGQAESICIWPHDLPVKADSPSGERLALNIHHLLRHEAYVMAVSDAIGGSAYVEYLTDALAEAAWERFRNMEKTGGIIPYFNSGSLKKQILSDRHHYLKRLQSGEETLLGVTLYPSDGAPAEVVIPENDAPDDKRISTIRWSDFTVQSL